MILMMVMMKIESKAISAGYIKTVWHRSTTWSGYIGSHNIVTAILIFSPWSLYDHYDHNFHHHLRQQHRLVRIYWQELPSVYSHNTMEWES